MIFDDLVNGPGVELDDWRTVRPLLFQAKHFVLDPDACAFITRLSSDEDLIGELREFAVPPFDKIAMSHVYGPDHAGWPQASFDGRRASFQSLTLWDHGRWKLYVAHEDGSSLAAIPGWTTNLPDGYVENTWATEAQPGEDAADHYQRAARVLGSLKMHRLLIDAFFLLMAQPKHYNVHFNEARRSFSRGKPVKYFARSEIKIALSDVAVLRRAFRTGTHATPRRHEVRRHFIHRGGERACIHDWQPLELEDGKKRWECACGRRRIERGPFERGDAGKGFVRQHYSITA